MNDLPSLFPADPEIEAQTEAETSAAPPRRPRPQPGERREQILQALAAMLQQPDGERITTAALARRLGVSEAALYRHFASKAQMFEGLLDFIEESVLTLVRQITAQDMDGTQGTRTAGRIVAMVLQFAERNPGMASVMAGDALVLEHERLRERMNLFFDKLEAQLRQELRLALQAAGAATPMATAQLRAALLVDWLRGRLQRYVRSGFRQAPTAQWEEALALLL
ncbi:TetR family transcriptional regulator [Melaminivora alkalimesophila]|uniref:TetR family transcriptional regulator n=2 Tax=Melaminivora alkalimesophila TaxID=1165852 RepID=A0A317R8G1_9BURK|nr:nucleoid occlusion factor SlmA [Melaminivora alkalimesophila]PWW43731.1 TetR family transcriptional regulator [Melaminivora alkalimesophila]